MIFTVLPRRFIDIIIRMVPQLTQVINFILTLEDMKDQDDYCVKDVSKLLGNRTLEQLYVIDPSEEAVDTDCLVSMHPESYDGSILYK